MRRRKESRPTEIYHLIDTKTGVPFYCGKTVNGSRIRLIRHRTQAKQYPRRLLSGKLLELGEHVGIRVIEVVPVGADWRERERFHISELRSANPESLNICAGGEGAPGFIHSNKARRAISIAMVDRNFSDEHRARISESLKGRKITWNQKIRDTLAGTTIPQETRTKISEKLKGKPNQRKLANA